MTYTLQFLQAVNDWQKGGDPLKKGTRLAGLTKEFPENLRTCSDICYRQEAHDPSRTWQLIVDRHLPLRISAWTTDLSVAKAFKGGVPPAGLQGVIFQTVPPQGSVILNLIELYKDPEFHRALADLGNQIIGRCDGIDRYGIFQSEVILDLPTGFTAEIYTLGGFSGTAEQIAKEAFQRPPDETEVAEVRNAMAAAGQNAGAEWWLSREGARNVLVRTRPHIERLRAKKAAK